MTLQKEPAGHAGQTKPQCGPSAMKQFNMASYFQKQFAQDVRNFIKNGRLCSGYTNLDHLTNLYPGLYVIGAISSLGKTTFIHQMCDQIAEAGSHVLFFSLEQSTLELASKSIARTIAKRIRSANEFDAKNGRVQEGLTSLQVRRADLSDSRILEAIDSYTAYADRITIIECSFRATIDDITNTVQAYIKQNQTRPVVIIDYLQVIQPNPESHMTTKDTVDFNVRRLKELQSDNQLTMIVISSLNRQNYMTAIDFESFKESGGIEYTADVVWGLQLQCIHDPVFSKMNNINEKRQKIKDAKRAVPRKVELVCLKNRFGVSSYSCLFDYYPNFDLFEPDLDGLNLGTAADIDNDTDGWMAIPPGLECELPWN